MAAKLGAWAHAGLMWAVLIGFSSILAMAGVSAMPRLLEDGPYVSLPGVGRVKVESTYGCDPSQADIGMVTIRVIEINKRFVAMCSETRVRVM